MKNVMRFFTANIIAIVLAWPMVAHAQIFPVPSPCGTLLCLGLYSPTYIGTEECYIETSAFFAIQAVAPPATYAARLAYLNAGVPLCIADAPFIPIVMSLYGVAPISPPFN